jgi:hypothetical protein
MFVLLEIVAVVEAVVVLVKSRRFFDCACACIRPSNDILGVANVIAVGRNLLVVVVVAVTVKGVVVALSF